MFANPVFITPGRYREYEMLRSNNGASVVGLYLFSFSKYWFLSGESVKGALYGGHFNKFHHSILQCRVKTERELKLNVSSTKWKINIFSSIFVKSRPMETRRSERVPLQIVSLKPPKFKQPFWNVEQSTMKINPKNPLTLKIFELIQSRGPS